MIYILEGVSGGGKTSYVNYLDGFEYKKLMLRTFDEIKAELEANEGKNIVYDRLFMNVQLNSSDEDLIALNEYLRSLPNVKCYKFMTDKESSFNKRVGDMERNNVPYNPEKLRERMDKEHDRYTHIFEVMTVFE